MITPFIFGCALFHYSYSVCIRQVLGRVDATTAQRLFQREFDIYRTHQPLKRFHAEAFAGYKVAVIAHAKLHHNPHQVEHCLLAVFAHLANAHVYKDVLR